MYFVTSYSAPPSAHSAMMTGTVISTGKMSTKARVIGKPRTLSPPFSSSTALNAGANATTRTVTPFRSAERWPTLRGVCRGTGGGYPKQWGML